LPQGSIVAPFLFLMGLSGLAASVKATGARILLYADDIVLMAPGRLTLSRALGG